MYKIYVLIIGGLISLPAFALVDPTQPISLIGQQALKGKDTSAKEHTLQLSSIIIRNGTKKAVINDEVLKEGEKIFDWTIKKINLYQVILESSQGTETLRFYTDVFKKLHENNGA